MTVEIAAPECPPGARGASLGRLALYNLGRRLPGGVHTPIALHLQALRAGRGSCERHDAMTALTPGLSVVIPTFNNEAVLRRCLTSWRAAPPSVPSRSS